MSVMLPGAYGTITVTGRSASTYCGSVAQQAGREPRREIFRKHALDL